MSRMKVEIKTNKNKQSPVDKEICDLIASTIDTELTEAENKIWHAHHVKSLESPQIKVQTKIIIL